MADITTGLLAWWKLNEKSGSIASDSTGNGYAGNLVNSPVWLQDNVGLQLNGVSQYIQLPNAIGINASFTFSCFLLFSTSCDCVLYSKGSDSSDGWGAFVDVSNTNVLSYVVTTNPGVGAYSVSSSSAIGINNWTHIAMTFDNVNKVLSIYSNGVLLGSTLTGSNLRGTDNVYLGVNNRGGSKDGYLNGIIRDARMYNRALSQDDVTALFNYTPPPELTTPIINVNSIVRGLSASWNQITNSQGYIINIYKDSILYNSLTVNNNVLSYLFSDLPWGDYFITVIAIGDNTHQTNSEKATSDTILVKGIWNGSPLLAFYGVSVNVTTPPKLMSVGISVNAVKLGALHFWGVSAVDAPESFLFYQIN